MTDSAVGSFFARAMLVISGAGLIAGFFMPWAVLAGGQQTSGFDLLIGKAEVLSLIFQPSRPMMLLVPILGVMLVLGGISGHRAYLWVSLAAGLTILGYGFYTLVTVFLQATGVGMWIVVASAFLSLAIGLLALGRRSAET